VKSSQLALEKLHFGRAIASSTEQSLISIKIVELNFQKLSPKNTFLHKATFVHLAKNGFLAIMFEPQTLDVHPRISA